MYFMPILVAGTIFLAYPSLTLALGVGIVAWLYLKFGGARLEGWQAKAIRGQLAYRILSVKMMTLNGDADDDTFEVHASVTPDTSENAEMRGTLRDAAAKTPEAWQDSARMVMSVYRNEHKEVLKRFDGLVVQMTAQPDSRATATEGRYLSNGVQSRLVQIAKMWRLSAAEVHAIMDDNKVAMSDEMLALR
jgi:hypothetical protein